jgi:hypothetical protein
MAIVITPKIRAKLQSKHGVEPEEVEQCFANGNGVYIEVVRKGYETPIYWFIADTHYGRKLQVVFVSEHGNTYICSAYPPNQTAMQNYLKKALV